MGMFLCYVTNSWHIKLYVWHISQDPLMIFMHIHMQQKLKRHEEKS